MSLARTNLAQSKATSDDDPSQKMSFTKKPLASDEYPEEWSSSSSSATSALVPTMTSPEEVRSYTYEVLLPMALTTYKDLMTCEDKKLRKASADKVLEIIQITTSKGAKDTPSGVSLHIDQSFLQAAQEGLKKVQEARQEAQIEEMEGTIYDR